jgi:signal transduction histidine kinase
MLLLMTGPDGLRNVDDDHQDRLLAHCAELAVDAVRLLAPEYGQPDEELRVCSKAELTAVHARADAYFSTFVARR